MEWDIAVNLGILKGICEGIELFCFWDGDNKDVCYFWFSFWEEGVGGRIFFFWEFLVIFFLVWDKNLYVLYVWEKFKL